MHGESWRVDKVSVLERTDCVIIVIIIIVIVIVIIIVIIVIIMKLLLLLFIQNISPILIG